MSSINQEELISKFFRETNKCRYDYFEALVKKYSNVKEDGDIIDMRTLKIVKVFKGNARDLIDNPFGSLTQYKCKSGVKILQKLKKGVETNKKYNLRNYGKQLSSSDKEKQPFSSDEEYGSLSSDEEYSSLSSDEEYNYLSSDEEYKCLLSDETLMLKRKNCYSSNVGVQPVSDIKNFKDCCVRLTRLDLSKLNNIPLLNENGKKELKFYNRNKKKQKVKAVKTPNSVVKSEAQKSFSRIKKQKRQDVSEFSNLLRIQEPISRANNQKKNASLRSSKHFSKKEKLKFVDKIKNQIKQNDLRPSIILEKQESIHIVNNQKENVSLRSSKHFSKKEELNSIDRVKSQIKQDDLISLKYDGSSKKLKSTDRAKEHQKSAAKFGVSNNSFNYSSEIPEQLLSKSNYIQHKLFTDGTFSNINLSNQNSKKCDILFQNSKNKIQSKAKLKLKEEFTKTTYEEQVIHNNAVFSSLKVQEINSSDNCFAYKSDSIKPLLCPLSSFMSFDVKFSKDVYLPKSAFSASRKLYSMDKFCGNEFSTQKLKRNSFYPSLKSKVDINGSLYPTIKSTEYTVSELNSKISDDGSLLESIQNRPALGTNYMQEALYVKQCKHIKIKRKSEGTNYEENLASIDTFSSKRTFKDPKLYDYNSCQIKTLDCPNLKSIQKSKGTHIKPKRRQKVIVLDSIK